MASILTDSDIGALIDEAKSLPANYRERIVLKAKRGHKERELSLMGSAGSQFRLILRQSNFNSLDFSVILAFEFPTSTQQFRLRRYNGKSHQHSNGLEHTPPFYDFHIHIATQRYQEGGFREDAFAEPTTRYADFNGALSCMLEDCGFILPEQELFLF